MRAPLGRSRGLVAAAVVVALLGWLEAARPWGLSLPRLTGGLVHLDLLIRAGIFTIVLVGLNLLMGYAGQVSLGQAAFYGMGAFFSAILTVRAPAVGIPPAVAGSWWWPWLLMVAGTALVGGFAYAIGLVILRLRGHYLAMATLGLGIVVYIVLRENLGLPHLNLTGGFDGVFGIPRLRLGPWVVWPASRYYFLVWAVALGAVALGLNLIDSRAGRALRAIHGAEEAAECLGIAAHRYKAQIFALSAALASLAGSLYAHFQAAVVPATFGFVPSLELVVMSAVGGMTSIWGAPAGAVAVLLMSEVLRTRIRHVIPGVAGEIEAVVFGLLLVGVLLFWPSGLVGRRAGPASLPAARGRAAEGAVP